MGQHMCTRLAYFVPHVFAAGLVASTCFAVMQPGAPQNLPGLQPPVTIPVSETTEKAAPAAGPATIDAESLEHARELLKIKLNAQLAEAAAAKDLPAAAATLRDLAKLQPGQWIPRFNLAAVLGRMGPAERDAAAEALAEAFSCGFDDFARLRADPALAAVLEHERISPIVAEPQKLLAALRDAKLAGLRKLYGPKYSYSINDGLRIGIASSVPEASLEFATTQMEIVRTWWQAAVLPQGVSAVTADGTTPDPWVMVVIPTRRDFDKWAAQVAGARAGTLAGLYDHDRRELVMQDTGSTLRHEFAHVLHWRQMMRLRQVHPVWVQEGLCSLIEDVVVDKESGTVKPVASWRTNTVRRMADTGNLPKFAVLFAMRPEKFTGERTLANYAMARAVFLFLAEQGKLRQWYAAYTEGFDAEPTGSAALAAVLGKPIEQIEKDFRVWARNIPEAPDANAGPRRTIGVELEQAADGLAVGMMGLSEMKTGGLRPGDVVQEVAGVAVRDWHDLARAIGTKHLGETVEVKVRRVRKVMILKVEVE